MSTSVKPEVASLLLSEAQRINSPEFIAADPVQFPRRFSRLQDIEITALIAAMMAWGKRTMICRDVERVIERMDGQPLEYVREGAWNEIPDRLNIHRTMFGEHLKHYLRGMQWLYNRYGSLDELSYSVKAGEAELPSYHLVEELNKIFAEANEGKSCSQILPTNLNTTALKRINMALRWLVRDDGIVDMGVWGSVPKSKLLIPLDVHVGNTARSLGLLSRKANDRRSVIELTEKLRTIAPDDPVLLDYALFGIGAMPDKAVNLCMPSA